MYNAVSESNNFRQKTFRVHLSSRKVIAFIWVMAFSLALAPLVGWSYYAPDTNGLW